MSTSTELTTERSAGDALVLPERPTTNITLESLRSRIASTVQRFLTRNIRDYVTVVDVGSYENLPHTDPSVQAWNGPTSYFHEVKDGRLVSYRTSQPMWNPDGTNSVRSFTIAELFNQGQNTPITNTFKNGAPDLYTQLLHNLAQTDTDFQINDLSDPGVRMHREAAVAKLATFENFADIAKVFGINVPSGAAPIFGGLANYGYVTNDFSNGLAAGNDPNRPLLPVTGFAQNAASADLLSNAVQTFDEGKVIWIGKNGRPLMSLSALDSQALQNPLAVYDSLLKKTSVDSFLSSRGAPAGSIPIINGRDSLDPLNVMSDQQEKNLLLQRKAGDDAFPVVRKELKEDRLAIYNEVKARQGGRSPLANDYVAVHGYRTPDGREVLFDDGPQAVSVAHERTSFGVDNSPITRDRAQIQKYMTDYAYGALGPNALSPADYIRQKYFGGEGISSGGASNSNGLSSNGLGANATQLVSLLATQNPDRDQLITLLKTMLEELTGTTSSSQQTLQRVWDPQSDTVTTSTTEPTRTSSKSRDRTSQRTYPSNVELYWDENIKSETGTGSGWAWRLKK